MDFFETEEEFYTDSPVVFNSDPEVTEETPILIQTIDSNPETVSEIPDAIQPVDASSNLAGEESAAVLPGQQTEENSPVMENNVVQGETAPDSDPDGIEQQIFKLLEERLPVRSGETVESETEQISESETELSLTDIENALDNIREFESEQLESLHKISDNIVVYNNNFVHLGIFTFSVICAIWGSILFYFLFKNIRS